MDKQKARIMCPAAAGKEKKSIERVKGGSVWQLKSLLQLSSKLWSRMHSDVPKRGLIVSPDVFLYNAISKWVLIRNCTPAATAVYHLVTACQICCRQGCSCYWFSFLFHFWKCMAKLGIRYIKSYIIPVRGFSLRVSLSWSNKLTLSSE